MKKKTNAFTLVEVLVYIAILSIMLLIVASFLLWSNKSNIKAKALNETTYNIRRAIETIGHETKEAIGIYTPTSLFSTSSGQLSLEIAKYLPQDETTSYVDFYLCENQICFKKEGLNPISITSENIGVSKLEFKQIATTSTAPSVQIEITAEYKPSASKSEYQAVVNVTSTATLRSY
jgi:type II secretory pathway pseudopilin PulG